MKYNFLIFFIIIICYRIFPSHSKNLIIRKNLRGFNQDAVLKNEKLKKKYGKFLLNNDMKYDSIYNQLHRRWRLIDRQTDR